MFKDLSMRIFLGHLLAYVAVTALSAVVNLWLTPQHLWWPWVLIGWGVAVATHAFALLLRKTRRRERIYWDQASLLAQLGLIDAAKLPVSGAEQAARLLDPSLPSNTLILRR